MGNSQIHLKVVYLRDQQVKVLIFTCFIDSEDVPVRIGKGSRRRLRVSEENYERADFSTPTFSLRYNF